MLNIILKFCYILVAYQQRLLLQQRQIQQQQYLRQQQALQQQAQSSQAVSSEPQPRSSQQTETLSTRVSKPEATPTVTPQQAVTTAAPTQIQLPEPPCEEKVQQPPPPPPVIQEPSSVSNIPTSVIQHAEPVRAPEKQPEPTPPAKVNNVHAPPTVTTAAEVVTTVSEIPAATVTSPTMPATTNVTTTVPSGSTHTTTTSELRQLRRPLNRGKFALFSFVVVGATYIINLLTANVILKKDVNFWLPIKF